MNRLTYHLLAVCVVWPLTILLAPIGLAIAAADLAQRHHRARTKAKAVAQGACSWGQDPPPYTSPDDLRQHPDLAQLEQRLDHIATEGSDQ